MGTARDSRLALSRRQHRFESGRGRQSLQKVRESPPNWCPTCFHSTEQARPSQSDRSRQGAGGRKLWPSSMITLRFRPRCAASRPNGHSRRSRLRRRAASRHGSTVCGPRLPATYCTGDLFVEGKVELDLAVVAGSRGTMACAPVASAAADYGSHGLSTSAPPTSEPIAPGGMRDQFRARDSK